MNGLCAQTCDCNMTIGNTGTGCKTPMAVEKRPWIMNETASDGTPNCIDLTSALDDAYFQGLINNADPLARLYPLPEIKNITDVRDKPLMFTWKDGTEVFVRDGIRKFEGQFPPDVACPQLVGILEGQRCSKPCKFSVDANGTVWGRISPDGTKLYPVKMDGQSVAALWVKTADQEPEMVGYSFNYHPSEKDCKIRGLQMSEMDDDATPLDYNGLLDVFAKVISCSATELVVKLYTIFGGILNPLTDKGLVAADFALYNVTNSSAIALTGTGATFSESSGTYTMHYATADDPTVADVLKLTPTKAGRDYTAVIATSIVVS